jgi:hypothetical protein
MSAKVAHEIKNPLTALKSLLQLEKAGARDERSQKRFEVMTSEVARIEAIVARLPQPGEAPRGDGHRRRRPRPARRRRHRRPRGHAPATPASSSAATARGRWSPATSGVSRRRC